MFVLFGGLIGYPSDDINKFLWMVRIGGGVYPEIKEKDYMGDNGQYRTDAAASETMLNSLMYKLSYYNFAEAAQVFYGQYGEAPGAPFFVLGTGRPTKAARSSGQLQAWIGCAVRLSARPSLTSTTLRRCSPRNTG